jgi:CDP-6-deoxy-D-xylo-4-hexulose-3-dehydrase
MNKLPSYIYNTENFVGGESMVLYSGPYWDHQEVDAAIQSLNSGKWITAGEKVYKFENTFSKYFNVKYSHMVNSGSSANLILIIPFKKLVTKILSAFISL